MARARSAGVILYRRRDDRVEVLLVHPGGPFWAKKDAGAWSIPKGEFDETETPETAARREFEEETGIALTAELLALAPVAQSRGKTVHAFAAEADVDPASISSNTFTLEWPPRSGRMQAFPEIDRAAWFSLDEARTKIVAGQRAILDELARLVSEV
jgi:predicted NUDIX family NTP pyrophosphohydrolase